jgi:hypothetical protein
VKRPAFQFYPADWQRDANLRRCSHAARGAWMDVLCLLHDADEYGVLRWPLKEIAAAAGAPLKLLRELADKGVLKGADANGPAYVYAPRHGGQVGDEVVLVPESQGPCWYCGRFVKDEHIRQRRGEGSRFTEENQPSTRQPKGVPKQTPKPPIGWRQGDGASSASSSASKNDTSGHTPPSAAGSVEAGDRSGRFEGHDEPQATPNPVAAFAIALTQAGFQCTSLNPDLVAYVQDGGTVDHLRQCAALPDAQGKSATYPIRIARRELATAAAPVVATPIRAAAPSRQAQGLASILGANAHELVADFAAGNVVPVADRTIAGGPVPAEPGRLSGR